MSKIILVTIIEVRTKIFMAAIIYEAIIPLKIHHIMKNILLVKDADNVKMLRSLTFFFLNIRTICGVHISTLMTPEM